MANVNIVGRREEGKTTLALYRAQPYKAKVIWDPRGMIAGIVVCNPDDLEYAIEKGEWRSGVPIVYRQESGDPQSEFDSVSQVLFPPKFTRGGFAFIIDEAGELQTPNSLHPQLLRIIKQHPTFPVQESVLIIQTNHRLSEFHNSCKALMNELYIFQTTLPRDLDVLEQHTGLPEVSEIVRGLPKHHCVKYIYGRVDEGMSQYEVWDEPSVWYIPLKGAKISENTTGNKNCDDPAATEEGSQDRNSPSSLRRPVNSNLLSEEDLYA